MKPRSIRISARRLAALALCALPATGFADDVGVPGLLALGAGLVAVLFIARRMRMSRA